MNGIKSIAPGRSDITDLERELFLKDFNAVAEEYFEREGETGLEITRTEKGFDVCVIFSAHRIKTVRRPV